MIAYLHYIALTGRWIAYTYHGHVIAQSESKRAVIAACEQQHYTVEEV